MSRTRVLIVEDEPGVAEALRRALAPDHDVVVASSVEEATPHVRRSDVIVLDLRMAGGDVQGDDVGPVWSLEAATVALSGYTERLARCVWADAQLQKPVETAALRAAVETARQRYAERRAARTVPATTPAEGLPAPLGAAIAVAERATDRIEDPAQRNAVRLIWALIVLVVLLAGASVYGVVRIQRLEDERQTAAQERCQEQIQRALAPVLESERRCEERTRRLEERYDLLILDIRAKVGEEAAAQMITTSQAP